MKNVKLFAFAGAAALAGCTLAGMPPVVSASQTGINYRVKPNQVAGAKDAAQRYCVTRNATARLEHITPAGKRAIASFYCLGN